jgi:hypothetical protein
MSDVRIRSVQVQRDSYLLLYQVASFKTSSQRDCIHFAGAFGTKNYKLNNYDYYEFFQYNNFFPYRYSPNLGLGLPP